MIRPVGRNLVNNLDGWAAPPATIALSQGEIHVWRAYLDVAPQAVDALASHLSAEETARADRFRTLEDRLRFAVCHGILRELLSKYLHQLPADVVIATSSTKKPFVHKAPLGEAVCFNLSHSGGMAAFAFAQGMELGIDIEYFREKVEFADIAEHYFSAHEKMEILAARPEERPKRFFETWTVKEAYLKAVGEGLPLLDKLHAPSTSENSDIPDNRVWSQYSFVPSSVHAGALVAEGNGHRLRFLAWNAAKVDP